MSDIMLLGVLRMPFDMAMRSNLSRRQLHARAQEAADTIEHLRKYARHYSNCQSLNPMLGGAACSCGFEVKR